MTWTVYGISNCDTVKKARKWLDAAGVTYRFHDFRKDGLETRTVTAMLTALGAEKLINKRGTTWRKLDPAAQAAAGGDGVAALLVAHPTLIKRPVIDTGDGWSVGFGKAEQTALAARRDLT
ncbi:MAG: Spx/MgsR family RNA polymerase-binding regulatory protein [Thalassobaculaceae bacterium]